MATTNAALALQNLREAGLEAVLHVPGQEAYEERIASYWSDSSRLRPWAFVQPRTVEEVSRAVKAITKSGNCQFAIRSGGHMCGFGANNIEEGVTIDLGLLNDVTYDPDTNIASLGSGARWKEVYAQLEEHGVLVGGGRDGAVGVGGFILGGGKTFFTCRYGFACDQVVNFEVVLADGRIVNANKTTNPDLFHVLKGGSNNFGIVTRFDMNTFKAMEVWDGTCVLAKEATDSVLDAFVGFAKNLTANPDSHILCLWTYLPPAEEIFITCMPMSFDGVENPASLQGFLTIQGQQDMKKTTIAKKMAEFRLPPAQHDLWFTLTFKLDVRIAKKATDVFEKLVGDLKSFMPDGNFVTYLVLQPLPASFAQHSVAQGGNMLGLDRLDHDSVLLVTLLEVPTPELATAVYPTYKEAIEEIESYAMSVDGNVEFRYLNYCDTSQDPFASYGKENLQKLRDAAVKYDPTGVFQSRVPGGFKVSKAKEC